MLRKENLNGDFFQQFKKYQQKEQPLSSLSIQHKKTTKTHGGIKNYNNALFFLQ
jgi:hypothetical protein